MSKRIYIIGGANGKELAPYDAERWGVNATCIGIECDMSFHMHDLNHQERYFMTGTNKQKGADFAPFLAYVKFKNHPVLSIHEYPDLPSIKAYPYKEVCDFFGTNYFSDSVCYMIAYALYKGYEEIHTYGVNLILANEYTEERPGLEFWLGMAHARGVRMGKEFKIIGDLNTLFQLPGRVNYAYEEKLWYEPEKPPRWEPIPWAQIGDRAI